MSEVATEEALFLHLAFTHQRNMNTSIARHISVGEPYLYVTANDRKRAQHGIRRIDALMMKRDISKGDVLWAIEIKVSANDLRKELQSPQKAETWAQYTHAFYFLVPENLADKALAEVPKQYGVMVARPHRVVIARRSVVNPNPLSLPLDTWRRALDKLGKYQKHEAQAAIARGKK